MLDFISSLIAHLIVAFGVTLIALAAGWVAGFAAGQRLSPGRWLLRVTISTILAATAVSFAVYYLVDAPGALPPYLVIAFWGWILGGAAYKRTAGAFK